MLGGGTYRGRSGRLYLGPMLPLQALTPERLAAALELTLMEARKVHAAVQREDYGQRPLHGLRRESAARLRERAGVPQLELVREQASRVDAFVKYALRTGDGHLIESV